jgi:hypothetical protein
MIVEVLKLIAEKGPLLCTAYAKLTTKASSKLNSELKSKPTIRYMTPEEEMRYLISTHNENNR